MRALSLFSFALLAGCGASQSLEPVTVGDTTIAARPDGSFDVTVAGRRLLAARAAPLSILDFRPVVNLLWGQFDYDRGHVVEKRPSRAAALKAEADGATLTLDGDGASATIRFARTASEVTITVDADAPGLSPYAMGLRFACDPAAHFLGFGEQYQRIDHRGEAFPLWVSEQGIGRDPMKPSGFSGNPYTSYFPVPFFLDPRGSGFVADTSARVEVDICKSDPETWSFTVDEGKHAVFRLYTGPTVRDVMRAFTALSGRSSYPPRWAVEGVWIGAQGGPARVQEAVDKALAANIPVSTVWVQDWLGKLDLGGGLLEIKYHWQVDPTLYPDLPGFIKSLHASGIKFLGYFNPFIVEKYGEEYKTAAAKNYSIRAPDGSVYSPLITTFTGSQLDVTNPEAVAWFQTYAKTALGMGQDGWMGDFGEWLPYDAVIAKGDAPHEHNLYPIRWHKAGRDLLDNDKVVFTRSGWLGEGKVAQVVWAGDQEANWSPWDGLPTVVPALISLGLAGIAYPTHDIAGFSGGPSTKELYMRWIELGAFTPVMRTHEGLASGVNWYWYSDPDTLAQFGRFSRIHKALYDTFRGLEKEHTDDGMPIVRALALTWPDDERAVTTYDEYTIGTDLLVAPVLEQGQTKRRVYFPRGHWVDVWDPAKSYDGPVEQMIDAPIGRPPVFSQKGRTDLKDIR